MRAPSPEASAPAPSGITPARDAGAAVRAVHAATGLSLAAALIHLWSTPERVPDWRAYGAFFLATALCQGALAALVLRRPEVSTLLAAGIVVNLAVVLVFVLTRTNGAPVGPHAGVVEGAGPSDVAATTAELGTVPP